MCELAPDPVSKLFQLARVDCHQKVVARSPSMRALAARARGSRPPPGVAAAGPPKVAPRTRARKSGQLGFPRLGTDRASRSGNSNYRAACAIDDPPRAPARGHSLATFAAKRLMEPADRGRPSRLVSTKERDRPTDWQPLIWLRVAGGLSSRSMPSGRPTSGTCSRAAQTKQKLHKR